MNSLTLHQLRCFDAVVSEGGFQAAADKLCRSQPTVFAAVKSLETQLGLNLLDRGGYRIGITAAGRSLHQRVRGLLEEYERLETHATQLAMGEEAELSVVIGDLCPLAPTLGLLRRFFDTCPATRLHLHFEAISGPWERLREGEADLIFHHIDPSDPHLESIAVGVVRLIPVVAPDFLQFQVTDVVTVDKMRDYVQCVIRDSARHSEPRDFYLVAGARSWTVSDQLMKREVILQGMGWGHMPDFLVEDDLKAGRLLDITGTHFPGGHVELVAARRRGIAHGPVAERLWRYVAAQLPAVSRPEKQEAAVLTGSI